MERELARIYVRLAKRAAWAANAVGIAGSLGTLSLFAAVSPFGWVNLALLGFGGSVTAALYAAMSALSARAQAAMVRHLAAAIQQETAAGEPALNHD